MLLGVSRNDVGNFTDGIRHFRTDDLDFAPTKAETTSGQ
jgi:hypothetical protein